MNFPYCPHLDRLGHDLIEAYRLNYDDQLFSPASAFGKPDGVSKIHLLIVEHRNSCPICHQIARSVYEGDKTDHVCSVH